MEPEDFRSDMRRLSDKMDLRFDRLESKLDAELERSIADHVRIGAITSELNRLRSGLYSVGVGLVIALGSILFTHLHP